ncbi:MAG: hypothetical protein R3228_17585 [Halioglobus sp.]|nr:hypothetical protein [Halioglobus sp.]
MTVTEAIDPLCGPHGLRTVRETFARLYDALYSQQHLPREVVELCRLRLAQLHGGADEGTGQTITIDAERRAALSGWPSDERFSSGEKACLGFAEVYAMDAGALTDDQAEAVRAEYGDAGLVTLIEALGVLDGLRRVSLLWSDVHLRERD